MSERLCSSLPEVSRVLDPALQRPGGRAHTDAPLQAGDCAVPPGQSAPGKRRSRLGPLSVFLTCYSVTR